MEFLWFTFKFLGLVVGCAILLAILVAIVQTLVERIMFKRALRKNPEEVLQTLFFETLREMEKSEPTKKTKKTTKKKDQN